MIAGDSPENGTAGTIVASGDNTNIPKPKRLACVVCRKRKLKCDGYKPSCSTCTRLGHSCAYDEVRRKSGPKRGYVKALEERLKQVETLLKTQDPPVPTAADAGKGGSPGGALGNGAKGTDQPAAGAAAAPPATAAGGASVNFNVPDPSINLATGRDADRWQLPPESPAQPGSLEDFNFNANMAMNMNNVANPHNFTWEMIGLGLEEPLPPQETIDDLHQIYFDKIHPSVPMIHKYRYLAAMNLGPNQRPPVCLRYAIWTLACSVADKYLPLRDLFYMRARKYIEADYIKGYGEHIICVAHAQTHILLASYELKMMYFPRAWMSTGAAVRLCQMIGLHRLDGAGLDVKQCLPPPRDWTEREERRRTFWMAFAEDRYSSIGTGWPLAIDERDVMTNLPSSEEAFEYSRPEQTMSLSEAMSPAGASKLSSFGGIVLMACLFGRNLVHLHRPDEDDRDNDLNGEFWKRHRTMDNILLNTSLCLPPHLKLPQGMQSPNVVYMNMSIHTSTICLHQAAIFKADKNRMPSTVSSESKVRCITAASEIASIMRMVSHMDLSAMNPFISFCLYVSSRVFVQYLKSRPEDSQSADSLRFLLSAMNALKRRNPLTESFLVQLDVDLEALGARIPSLRNAFQRSGDSPHSGNVNANGTRTGAPCDEGPNNGIFTYRNECHFLKTVEDDGNPTRGPELTTDGGEKGPESQTGGSGGSGNVSSATWLNPEIRLPTRERSSGPSSSSGGGSYQMRGMNHTPNSQSMFGGGGSSGGSGFGQSDSGDTGDVSTSPNAGASNQPTPNSSTPSEQRHSLSTAAGGGGGRGSFEASPVSPSQVAAGQGMGAFFNHSAPGHGFDLGSPGLGMMPDGSANQFAGWEMSGQTGMTPAAEGMLRSLMQMEPMDTMDLGWVDPS